VLNPVLLFSQAEDKLRAISTTTTTFHYYSRYLLVGAQASLFCNFHELRVVRYGKSKYCAPALRKAVACLTVGAELTKRLGL